MSASPRLCRSMQVDQGEGLGWVGAVGCSGGRRAAQWLVRSEYSTLRHHDQASFPPPRVDSRCRRVPGGMQRRSVTFRRPEVRRQHCLGRGAGAAARGGTEPAAVASKNITNDQVFASAQLTYPELFPGTPATFSAVVYQGKSFSGRAYANGNYLAVANGEAWGLGPFTNQVLQSFGVVQNYVDLVCTLIDCGRAGPANILHGAAE